ncbi:prepilin-type N-terminal cleavage/methylation domain-containing protein [Parelusimicrobium proximum]|uniref:type IV pilin protein n=1 Tax=Parelusimicrobium proximum TaxID=3228953 RepID=UPI003D180386
MKKGFTLIELLVVVLIIAILAAVALPQYTRAVAKSKAVQLNVLVRSAGDAIERYYLQNDDYPLSLDELDIDIPGTKITSSLLGASTPSGRRNDNYEIILSSYANSPFLGIAGLTTTGKYKGGYVGYYYKFNLAGVPLRTLICMEDTRTTVYTAAAGEFCQGVLNYSTLIGTANSTRIYKQ